MVTEGFVRAADPWRRPQRSPDRPHDPEVGARLGPGRGRGAGWIHLGASIGAKEPRQPALAASDEEIQGLTNSTTTASRPTSPSYLFPSPRPAPSPPAQRSASCVARPSDRKIRRHESRRRLGEAHALALEHQAGHDRRALLRRPRRDGARRLGLRWPQGQALRWAALAGALGHGRPGRDRLPSAYGRRGARALGPRARASRGRVPRDWTRGNSGSSRSRSPRCRPSPPASRSGSHSITRAVLTRTRRRR